MVLSATVLVAAQFIATLQPKTVAAFDQYFQGVDASMRTRAASASPLSTQAEGVTPHAAGKDTPGNGMIHDWSVVAFVPGAKKAQAVAILEGFDRHPSVYPEVLEGRVEKRDGGAIDGFHRIRKKKVLEVTLEARYRVEPVKAPGNRYASRSVATEIIEIDKDKKRTPGHDHGFLWRLNTFWILEETTKGLWMECRSVSLTRDTPMGLGWAINPIVRDLPKESLLALMEATKRAMLAGK